MEVLEKLRFKNVGRLLLKKYTKGTVRHIEHRLHSGFVFCVKGKVNYTNDKIDYIGDCNHVLLAPQGCKYDLVILEDCVCSIIDFDLESGFFEDIYLFEIFEAKTFYNNYLNLEKRYMFDTNSKELMGLSNLYDLTARINGYGLSINKYKVIEESEKYLQQHIYEKSITITEIAKQSNVSEVYFRRLFKEKYNLSPYEYINEARIKKAKQMLIYSDNNVSEIAEECGFLNIFTFSRYFKTIVGVSPNSFRKIYVVSEKTKTLSL